MKKSLVVLAIITAGTIGYYVGSLKAIYDMGLTLAEADNGNVHSKLFLNDLKKVTVDLHDEIHPSRKIQED